MRASIRVLVATVIAGAAVLAAPAAEAATIYPPTGSCVVDPTTTTPGGTVAFSCAAETFSPNEQVKITVTGENGAAAEIGFVRTAIATASADATSTADGSLASIDITLPSDARGTYNIAAVSPTSAGGTAAVTVTSADGSLPTTGLDSAALTWLWVAGGALVVAGAALGVVALVRRRRDLR